MRDLRPIERRAKRAPLDDELARALVEGCPDALMVVDANGRIALANLKCETIFGYSPAELLGMSLEVLIPHALESSPVRLLVAHRRDRSEIPVEVAMSPMLTSHGRLLATSVRDATARQRSERALRESEARLIRAQRVAHLGSWEWDVRTNDVERSRGLLELFGLPPDGAEPRRWALIEYIHPDDLPHVERATEEAVRNGLAYTIEHRILRTDRTERIVLQHGEPILENGQTTRMVGTLLDVTELRKAELEREASLTWLRGVFEHSPVGLLLLHGTGGERVEANSRAKALLGPSSALVATWEARVLDAAGAPLKEEQLPSRRALRGEDVDWTEYLVRQPSGALVPVLAGAAAIRDANARVNGAVVVFQDITAVKELDRLRAEWSSVVAHDLRQPLQTMLLCAQVVLLKEQDADSRHALERIRSAGQRLNRMIADLMDLSRLDARRLELVRERRDIVPLVRECLDRFSLEAPERTVHMQVRGEPRYVWVDQDRLSQILDNLLSNALKYGAPASPIGVDIEGDTHELSVAVTNQGRGIPAEELPIVFRRFRRGVHAGAGRVKGTGLGLYITHELVGAHGGRLTVESTPGGTTTFRFTLPVG